MMTPTYSATGTQSSRNVYANQVACNTLYCDNIIPSPSSVLPPPLDSIVSLSPIAANSFIYTGLVPDVFQTTPISAYGVGWMDLLDATAAQGAINLIPGTTVQAFNSTLAAVASTTFAANSVVATTGVANTFTTHPLTAYATGLLAQSTAPLALAYLGGASSSAVAGGTVTHLSQFTAVDSVGDTGVVVTGGADADLQVDKITSLAGDLVLSSATGSLNLGGIYPALSATTVPPTSWAHVATMDQDVAVADSPSFFKVTATDSLEVVAGAGTVLMGSHVVGNVADPLLPQDAATRSYVDAAVLAGPSPFAAASVATTTATGLAAPVAQVMTTAPAILTVDGVLLVTGMRILVKDAVSPNDTWNGIYTAGVVTSVWTRATDFNQAVCPIASGRTVFISAGGTLFGNSVWSLQAAVTQLSPLSSAVIWTQTASGFNPVAGNGIVIAGTTISTRLNVGGGLSNVLGGGGNELGLTIPVIVAQGGTNTTALTAGNVMVGNGAGAVLTTKAAPAGAFVGTTDTQTVINKDMTTDDSNLVRATQLGDAAPSTYTVDMLGGVPVLGDVLQIIGAGQAAFAAAPAPAMSFTYNLELIVAKPNTSVSLVPDYTSFTAAYAGILLANPDLAVPVTATNQRVTCATTANIGIAPIAQVITGAPAVVDGVTLVVGDRILVKNEVTTTWNGVYTAGVVTTTWTRLSATPTAQGFNQAAIAAAGGSIYAGRSFFVVYGTTQASTSWSLQTAVVTVSPPTSAVVFISNPRAISLSNQCILRVYPATYIEALPLTPPTYVSTVGMGDGNELIVIQPTFATRNNDGIILGYSTSFLNILVDASPYASIGGSSGRGVNVTYAVPTDDGYATRVENTQVRDYVTGFVTTGQGATLTANGLINSSVCVARNLEYFVSDDMTAICTAYRATNASAFITFTAAATGAINSPSLIDTCLRATGGASTGLITYAIFTSLTTTYCATCVDVENADTDLRIQGGSFSKFTTDGIHVSTQSNGTFIGINIQDDTAFAPYANQVHLRSDAGILAQPTRVKGMSLILRGDLVQLSTSFTDISGDVLSTEPGNPTNLMLGNASIGFPNYGFTSSFGEGQASGYGMQVWQATLAPTNLVDGTFAANITSSVKLLKSGTAGTSVFFGGAGAVPTGYCVYFGGFSDGVNANPFYGLKMDQSNGSTPRAALTTILPVGGNLNYSGLNGITSIEPPQYSVIWEYYSSTPTTPQWIRFAVMSSTDSSNSPLPITPTRGYVFDTATSATASDIRFSSLVTAQEQLLPNVSTYTGATFTLTQFAPASAYTPDPLSTAFALGSPWNGKSAPVWTARTLTGGGGWPVVNANARFWVRARVITTPLVANPFVNAIKLHTNSTTLGPSGETEYYGASRPIIRIDNGFNNWMPSSDQNIAHGMAISVKLDMRADNNFRRVQGGRVTRQVRLPLGCDTSFPLVLQWTWFSITAGAPGSVTTWQVNWGYGQDYARNTTSVSDIYGTAALPANSPTEKRIVFTTPAPVAANIRKQIASTVQLDISNLLPFRISDLDGDILWISLERPANNVYTESIYVSDISISCKMAWEGQHQQV